MIDMLAAFGFAVLAAAVVFGGVYIITQIAELFDAVKRINSGACDKAVDE